jgi:hypothetical protein
MGAKIRVHPGNSPGHRQFAHLFTRRLLCQLSYTGSRHDHQMVDGCKRTVVGPRVTGQSIKIRKEDRTNWS